MATAIKTKQPLTGPALLKAAMNQILKHPERWYQAKWHCGTSHCLFGWCQILAGHHENATTCYLEVKKLLRLSPIQAESLASASAPLMRIYTLSRALLAAYKTPQGKKINANGFDDDGFDSEGYNTQGFNRHGYDREGYTIDGFDSNGYNRAGYNKYGYNSRGLNIYGYPDLTSTLSSGKYKRFGTARDHTGRLLPLL